MARKEIRWRSNNGNLYTSEELALQADKELLQINEMNKLYNRGTLSLFEIVRSWDKILEIMNKDYSEADRDSST